MSRVRVVGSLDHNFGWLGGRLHHDLEFLPTDGLGEPLYGAMAALDIHGEWVTLFRDSLGINKIFWTMDDQDGLRVAARPKALVSEGYAFDSIRAFPSGTLSITNWQSGSARVKRLPGPVPDGDSDDASVESVAAAARRSLEDYTGALAAAYRDAEIFVCLSGGLDSSIIALLVARHFETVTAVSFDIARANGTWSADRHAAQRLAQDLGLSFLPVNITGDQLLDSLDTTLTEAIDWRDFNVHAGLVNIALAAAIAEVAGPRRLAFTGDIMNELLVDYHAEVYRGQTYYRLPSLRPRALQHALLRGMETSHREVGPFEAYGIPVVQPYAAVVRHYLQLPEAFLADPARKERLARLLIGDQLPDYVYGRAKTRAQVGDPEVGSGVLALCVDRGIDSAYLANRFAELHQITDGRAMNRFLRAGRYRSAVPGPQPEGKGE